MRVHSIVLAILIVIATSPAARAQPAPPSKTLERAIALYDREDYYSASIELGKVLFGETADDPANVARAEWFQAKTFAHLGFHAAALTLFDRIVQASPPHAYRIAAVKWLVAALDQAPSQAARELLALYPPGTEADPTLDDAARDAYLYYRGRRASEQNDPDAARILGQVRPTSPLWSRAQLELAELRFRTKGLDAGLDPAVAAGRDPGAAMAAVRMIAFWNRHRRAQGPARDALAALSGGDSAAAGAARLQLSRMAVEAEGGLPGLAPLIGEPFDAVVLAAVCPDGSTDHLLGALIRTARASATAVGELAQYDDHAELFTAVTRRIAAPAGPADLMLRVALSDSDTAELVAWQAELAHELDLLERSDRAWQTTQVAAEILQEVTIQQALAVGDAGRRFHDRLGAIQRELDLLVPVLASARGSLVAGPDVVPGRGLVVTPALCTALAGTAATPVVQPTPIATPPPPRSRGCAGCGAGHGEPTALVIVLAAGGIAVRRARRSRLTRDGSSPGTRSSDGACRRDPDAPASSRSTAQP